MNNMPQQTIPVKNTKQLTEEGSRPWAGKVSHFLARVFSVITVLSCVACILTFLIRTLPDTFGGMQVEKLRDAEKWACLAVISIVPLFAAALVFVFVHATIRLKPEKTMSRSQKVVIGVSIVVLSLWSITTLVWLSLFLRLTEWLAIVAHACGLFWAVVAFLVSPWLLLMLKSIRERQKSEG